MDARGMNGRSYVCSSTLHCCIQNILYFGSGGFRKEDCSCISHSKPWQINTPWAWPVRTPAALLAGFIKMIAIHSYT